LIKSKKLRTYIMPLFALTLLLGLYACPAQQTTQQVVIQNVVKDSSTQSSTNPSTQSSPNSVATVSPQNETNLTGTWIGSYMGITQFYTTATCSIALSITQSGTDLSGTASNTCSMTGLPSQIVGSITSKNVYIIDTVSGVEFNGILTTQKIMQGTITGVMGTVNFYKN